MKHESRHLHSDLVCTEDRQFLKYYIILLCVYVAIGTLRILISVLRYGSGDDPHSPFRPSSISRIRYAMLKRTPFRFFRMRNLYILCLSVFHVFVYTVYYIDTVILKDLSLC